jgi:surfactin synthase thioesterase subunit
MNDHNLSKWFPYARPSSLGRVRVLCIPFAGGSASVFREWVAEGLGPHVEMMAVQAPGREQRCAEEAFTRMEPLIEVLRGIVLRLPPLPTFLFGHSLGGLVAFELAHALRHTPAQPKGVWVAGAPDPGYSAKPERRQLPTDRLKEELRELGGTPAEVLENEELFQFFLPTIRADFEIFETYSPRSQPLLDMPILALAGKEDPEASPDVMAKWRQWTTGPFQLCEFDGGHFFPIEQPKATLARLRSELEGEAEALSPSRC